MLSIKNFFSELFKISYIIYSEKNNIKNIITKIIYSIFWLLLVFSIFLVFSQYFIYSIPNLNINKENADFFIGFVNGYCVFFNSIISIFSDSYSVIEPNVNERYYSGFASGILFTYFVTSYCKFFVKHIQYRFSDFNLYNS